MGRTALIVAVSLLVGAGLTYLLRPAPQVHYAMPVLQIADDRGPSASDAPSVKGGTALTLSSLLDGSFGVRERAAVYEIAATAGLDTLSSMARELWVGDQSMSTEFALDVVFQRMTEIDRDAGIDLIRAANPEPRQALAAALTVIISRGVTSTNMGSILAALPQVDERRFKTEALERLATADPGQALALAVGERDLALRVELLREVAVVWSARDLKAALAAMVDIADGADRAAFESGLTTRLAQNDPEKVLLDAARAPTVPERQLEVLSAVRGVAKTDPTRALELADGLKGQQRDIALRAAIQAWGSEDPYGALGFVLKLGPGRDRETLLQAIGEELGRQDPNGALAWFHSLHDSPQGLYGSILQGIGRREPQRAFELALDSGDPTAVFMTSMAVRSGEVSFVELAAHVLAMDGGAGREQRVQMLMSTWTRNDPDEALSWLVGHSKDAGRVALGQAAEALARQNPDAAIRATQSLPAEYREDWVRAVTSGYAQTDPGGAKAWIERFRGEPVYDAGMMAVVQASARRDPAGAAAMLPSFADAAKREHAAMVVAQQWAQRDAGGARDWTTTLPPGSLRDAALTGMMLTSNDLPDAPTLARFQSDQARRQAILDVVTRRAQVNVDDARAMVEHHVDDPVVRAQAEQLFQRMKAPPGY